MASAAWVGVVGVSIPKAEQRRSDSIQALSANQVQDQEHHPHQGKIALPPSYPLPLVGFVCFLAIVCGLVVVGVHGAVKYAGCPLGLNGCNAFLDKEEKGFFLVRWVQRTFAGKVPEDVVYIACSCVGAVAITEIWKWLPEKLVFQCSGGGTIQALAAVAAGERITLTAAVVRIFVCCIYLGTGGTLGSDGPAIQVCTAVTTFLGWISGMRAAKTQSLLACLGFAGGFAASFNSPLAGILFAMEELQHCSPRVSKHIICICLLTSVVATGAERWCHGDRTFLEVDWQSGGSPQKVFGENGWMLVSIPIALICSVFGFLISKTLECSWRLIACLEARVPTRLVIILMVTTSACVGSCVFQITGLRGVWGIGYESLQLAFNTDHHIAHFFVFAMGKALAMVISVASLCPGSILEPVLISGAFLGGGVGSLLQLAFDEPIASQVLTPCLTFGMVGLFASCFRFYLTPVVIVLELMGPETYAIVLPTALASFTAVTASNRLFPPLYDILMHRQGIDLETLINEADDMADGSDDEHERSDDEPPSEAGSIPSRASRVSSASSSKWRIVNNVESAMLTLGETHGSTQSPNNSDTHSQRSSSKGSHGSSRKCSSKKGSRTVTKSTINSFGLDLQWPIPNMQQEGIHIPSSLETIFSGRLSDVPNPQDLKDLASPRNSRQQDEMSDIHCIAGEEGIQNGQPLSIAALAVSTGAETSERPALLLAAMIASRGSSVAGDAAAHHSIDEATLSRNNASPDKVCSPGHGVNQEDTSPETVDAPAEHGAEERKGPSDVAPTSAMAVNADIRESGDPQESASCLDIASRSVETSALQQMES